MVVGTVLGTVLEMTERAKMVTVLIALQRAYNCTISEARF